MLTVVEAVVGLVQGPQAVDADVGREVLLAVEPGVVELLVQLLECEGLLFL